MSAMIHALANYLRNHQPTYRPANLTNGKSAVINPVSPRIETYTEGGSDKPPEQKHSVRIMSPPWDRLHGAQHRHMSSQSPSLRSQERPKIALISNHLHIEPSPTSENTPKRLTEQHPLSILAGPGRIRPESLLKIRNAPTCDQR